MTGLLLIALLPLQEPKFTSRRADDLYKRSAPKVAFMVDQAEIVIKRRGPFNLTVERVRYSAALVQQIDDWNQKKRGFQRLGLVRETEACQTKIEDLEQRKKDLGLGLYDKLLEGLWNQANEAGRTEAKKMAEVSIKNVELAFEYERQDIERFCELMATKFEAKRDLDEATKAYQGAEKKTQDRSILLAAYKKKKEANDLLEETNRELKKAAKGFFVVPSIEP